MLQELSKYFWKDLSDNAREEKMRKRKGNLQVIPYLLILAIIIGLCALSFTACIKYGNKPITEIPAWALLFMFGGGK